MRNWREQEEDRDERITGYIITAAELIIIMLFAWWLVTAFLDAADKEAQRGVQVHVNH
jgi:hypothetical protein